MAPYFVPPFFVKNGLESTNPEVAFAAGDKLGICHAAPYFVPEKPYFVLSAPYIIPSLPYIIPSKPYFVPNFSFKLLIYIVNFTLKLYIKLSKTIKTE